ncbi:hypothetical protein ABH908_001087 [Pseudomonas frederiksbergensis]|uniref:hypothetical protein n=1 Tax=Pseudomonas TaxID=286 RepID=UPI0003A39D6C|nr:MULTISPECIES: hypothetical protein [unclassified Pseudomonas]MBD9621235.1 hypothetical protein [Pseudomonas sp. PDM07]
MDKAISWPLSQEIDKSPLAQALRTLSRPIPTPKEAPLEGKVFDQAPVLRAINWSKNEQ